MARRTQKVVEVDDDGLEGNVGLFYGENATNAPRMTSHMSWNSACADLMTGWSAAGDLPTAAAGAMTSEAVEHRSDEN